MSADTFTAPAAPPRELPGRGAPQGSARRRLAGFDARLAVAGALLGMLAASLALRTVSLHLYYWIDEGISVGIASHPLSHIPGLMRQDGSPPLYYLILHVWMALFGRGEVATHDLSLVFSLLTIPVAYWAGASLFGRRTGLFCAVLAAGAPYLTSYAQETRMYSLVALLSILVAASFAHGFVYRRRRYLPLFSLSLTAAAYSHNWALFLGLMCGVGFLWVVWARPGERRALWRDGLLSFGAVVILFAPWVPTLIFQARHTGAPWDLSPVVWSLTQGLYFLVGGRGAAMVLLMAGGVGLASLWARSARATGGQVRQPSPVRLAAESFLLLGLGTLVVAWAYSKITPAWADRYEAVIVGPLLLLFGLGLSRAGRLGLVALVLAVCFWVLDPVPSNLNSKSNVATVAAHIRPHLGRDPLVLSTQPEQVPVLAYYLPEAHRFGTPLGRVPDPRVVDWRNALGRLRRSSVHGVLGPMIAGLRAGQRVALIVPAHFPKTPEWMRLINRASARWAWFLDHDHQLRRVASTNLDWTKAGVAVQATVFERR